jgi:hypothetical protein
MLGVLAQIERRKMTQPHYSAGATLFGFFMMMFTVLFVLPMALIVYIIGSLIKWIIKK